MRPVPFLSALLLAAPLPARGAPAPLELDAVSPGALELSCAELSTWDAQHGDWLGYAVATSGEWLLAGAPYDDLGGGNSGSVAAYRLTEGAPEQVDLLAPGDGHRGMYFGMSLAISGERCAIGAPWDDDRGHRSGSAYVFRWNGELWQQEAKLVAPDGAAEDRFGYSVAIDGEQIAVGARWDDDLGENCGSVYLFERDGEGWPQVAKLVPEQGGARDELGISVALSGDRLAVGAFGDPHQGNQSGAAYVFHRRDLRWNLEARLLASDAVEGDGFGLCVALDGTTCVVGAPWKGDSAETGGAVYVFEGADDTWTQRARLVPGTPVAGGHFGRSVSISGDRVLVGAPYGGAHPARSGAAFLYRRPAGSWKRLGELPRPRSEARDGFGWAVALSGERIAVGARGLDAAGTGTDHGHLFAYSPPRRR